MWGGKAFAFHQICGDRSFMPVSVSPGLTPFSIEGVGCVPCETSVDEKSINVRECTYLCNTWYWLQRYIEINRKYSSCH